MIAFCEVRVALESAKPDFGIDALIRRELQTCIKTKQIRQNLIDLLPEIKDIPNLTEDAEEGLNGALDALIGWCSPACAYIDEDAGDRAAPIARECAKLISLIPPQDQERAITLIRDELRKSQENPSLSS